MLDESPFKPKKLLTNEGENTLSSRLEKILPLTHDFDCLVGYFFISGFFRLYPALEGVEKIRILIGLRNDHVVHELVDLAGDSDVPPPSTAEIRQVFARMLQKELVRAPDAEAVEIGIFKFIEWIGSGKLQVKLYREQNIHAKVYIMTPENPVADVNHGYVITGSSNLSRSGLEGNLEFNVLLSEPEEHDYALWRFEELWKQGVDVEDVRQTILDTVKQNSPYAEISPYELYLRLLAEYFRDYLGDRSKLEADYLPRGFMKLSYQEDAVFTAQQMLKAYGGVFLADVVGLGKTYMSALLALQLDGRCLVIAPPATLDEESAGSWTRVFRDFGVPGHRCESIGKLEELVEHGTDAYKYVFVDEAHRFKGDATQRYEQLSRICRNKGVILVSATPYNNTLDDIYSQLKLFMAPRNSLIPGVRNLEAFFDKLKARLKGLHRLNDAEAFVSATRKNSEELREHVLKHVMVRRTRTEIEKYYSDDLNFQGLKFPSVRDPEPMFYQLDADESRVFEETLRQITSHSFHYARWKSLDPAYYSGPIDPSAMQGQRNLASLMRLLLVKRLESSFYAFRLTLGRFIRSHEDALHQLDSGDFFITKRHAAKVAEYLENGDDAGIERLIEEGRAARYSASDFTPEFRRHVAEDLAKLRAIEDMWSEIVRDPKWDEFKRQMSERRELCDGKVIIFTESTDTATYLTERLNDEVDPKTLGYSGSSGNALRREVIRNFDANDEVQLDDYRILVTTDALAEGVNLHRSSVVVNYDIPWNPGRLMQRVGRVNRVGTHFDEVSTFNFFPTDEGNSQIALTEAAMSKIQAFITLLGNDARLLTGEEQVTSHSLFARINSKEAAEGDQDDLESELKYLRVILDVKSEQPDLYSRVTSLPAKARSTRQVGDTLPEEQTPSLVTYFRRGALDKFFMSDATGDTGSEMTFMEAAQLLETNPEEALQKIGLNAFYGLLRRNKSSFADAVTPTIEEQVPAAAKAGNEGIVLKRLRAKEFRHALDSMSEDDVQFAKEIVTLIADGRIAKNPIRRVKEAFDRTDDPSEMVAVLRSEISVDYLRKDEPTADQGDSAEVEIVLSSFLL